LPDPDPRLHSTGEELAAKSRIAAALIAGGKIDVDNIQLGHGWMENASLKLLNGLVCAIYDAVERKL
jgi:hypothetical protein